MNKTQGGNNATLFKTEKSLNNKNVI